MYNQSIAPKQRAEWAKAVSEYWFAYGDNQDKPDGESRRWTNNDSNIIRNLRGATQNLICAMAQLEKLAIDVYKISESNDLIEIRFSSLKIAIVPLVQAGPSNKKLYKSFYAKLKSDYIYFVNIPFRATKEDCQAMIDIRDHGIRAILLAPEDIDNLALSQWTLLDMLQYKFTKVYLLGGIDADAVYVNYQVGKFLEEFRSFRSSSQLLTIDRAIELRKEEPEKWVQHPKSEKMTEYLETSPGLFVVGASSSGKSILALDYGIKQQDHGDLIYYINIASLFPNQLFRLGAVLYKNILLSKHKIIVVVDDLQCNFEMSKSILSFLRFLSRDSKTLKVISICWTEYLDDFSKIWPEANVLRVEASDIQSKIINSFDASLEGKTHDQIIDAAGEDLLILKLYLDRIKLHGLPDDEIALAEEVWKQKSKELKGNIEDLTRGVMVMSLFGQYEIALPGNYLKNQIGLSGTQIEELFRAKIILSRGGKYSLPHRSLARLYAMFLDSQKSNWAWFEKRGKGSSFSQLLIDYFQFIDPSEIWPSLELIQRIERKSTVNTTDVYLKFLVESWKIISSLLNKIYDQQETDPTWGSTISSATFACEALGEVGKFEHLEGSLSFIRNLYRREGNILKVDLTQLATGKDFLKIRERMAKEEKINEYVNKYSLEKAAEIDVDLMHENWASGLVLDAEEASNIREREKLIELAKCVENRAEPGGYFYPARVPWVTARVLIGLGRCGRNIHNSDKAKRAADWLIRSRDDGGGREDVGWAPGTGTWNNKVEVTAMCISALREVGVPTDNQALRNAMEWLWRQKKEWTEIGRELDGSVAIEAYLSMNGNWRDIIDQIKWLSAWAIGQSVWMYATESADKTMEQSCRAAQIAAFLIRAMWSIIRNDLAVLLSALGLQSDHEHINISNVNKDLNLESNIDYDVAISFAGEDRAYVQKVVNCLKKSGVRVFYDKDKEVDLWGKNLYEYLDLIYRIKAKYCVIFLSEDYRKKAWTSHERQSAQVHAFFSKQEYILPVRLDDTEIPGISELVGYVDARKKTPAQLCKMIKDKLDKK